MQIVIDLPEKIYKRIAVTPRCASTFDAIEDRDVFVKAVQKGTIFPKDATNGDVIKALFPGGSQVKGAGIYVMNDNKSNISYDFDWWNALYKAGDTE